MKRLASKPLKWRRPFCPTQTQNFPPLRTTVILAHRPTLTHTHIHFRSGGAVATACVLTRDKRLSCGVERKYHGATDMNAQLRAGTAYINKLNNQKH